MSGPGGRGWTLVGLLMLVAGAAGLGHRTLTWTDRTTQVVVGSVEVVTAEDHRFRIPMYVSLGLIVAGAGLLVRGART